MVASIRPDTDALLSLDEAVASIRVASERFDQGRHTEATTLAGHLCRVLHHSDRVDGLMARLGLLDHLTWVDTAGVPNPKTTCSTAGLTLMRIRSRHHGPGEFVPKLAMYPPMPIRTRSGERIDSGSRIPFEHWWTNPVVKDAGGAEYSRRQLVLALGEVDDPDGAAAREALGRSSQLGWIVRDGLSADRPLCGNPVIASVRQIGYEVLRSINEQREVIDSAA